MSAHTFDTVEEIEAWRDEIRSERLNDTGRALVDFAAEVLRSAIAVEPAAVEGVTGQRGADECRVQTQAQARFAALHKAATHVDKLVRAAMVADKGEADRMTEWLRKQAQVKQAMGSQFDEIH